MDKNAQVEPSSEINQPEKCYTMHHLEYLLRRDSSLGEKLYKMELENQEWLQKNGRIKFSRRQENDQETTSYEKTNNRAPASFCGYDNTYFTTISAPTSLNQVVSPSPNCTYGGEYVTITGLVAGNIYRISTCGLNNFDTQLSIYTSGGATDAAHNDDACGSQSEILFNPLANGNYDVLLDEYNCLSNSACASLEVELVYTPRPVVTIPVVVHVLHSGESIGTGSNLSSVQIQSQINILNEDFRRNNSNLLTTPAAFRGVSDDALIEFCLAQQEESGDPTTGINRYDVGTTTLTMSDMESTIKPVTIWDRDLYLNIWTWNGIGAYAQFPGGPANTDGVVVQYDNFGNTGNVASPFNLGKTTVHEIGHWLNLRHIWGDSPGCSVDDSVSDTPLQDLSTTFGSCPTFPTGSQSCSGTYPGTMYCNQMDYSGDACLSMFTLGQTSRMEAALFNQRSSLLSSPGCLPSTVGITDSRLVDMISISPNPSSGSFTIHLNEQLKRCEVKIINSLGEVVFIENLDENSVEMNLSNLSQGIYLAAITTSYGTVNKRIVITK